MWLVQTSQIQTMVYKPGLFIIHGLNYPQFPELGCNGELWLAAELFLVTSTKEGEWNIQAQSSFTECEIIV